MGRESIPLRKKSGQPMNLIHLLFNFQGRINRAKFWLALLIYVVFFFGGLMIVMAATSSLSTLFGAALVLYVPIIASGIAVGIKRLHDRNKTGWWLLLFYFGPLLLQTVGYYVLGGPEGSDGGVPQQILVLASFVINIWSLVELGCLRGSIGPNPYGPDPIAPAPAPPRPR